MDPQADRAARELLRMRLLSRTLTRTVLHGIRRHPSLATTAGGAPEVKLIGLDPVRVLVVGSGLALGYGVASHQDGFTGAVAERMQERTGRGAIVQNRSAPRHDVEQTVAALGLLAAASFGTVVWCFSLLEVVHPLDRGRYRRALVQGLELLRATALPEAEIVLCALPLPTARGPVEDIARLLVPRFNRALVAAAAPFAGVRVAGAPDFTTLFDPAAFSADYYRAWAAEVVPPDPARTARSA